MLSTVSKNAKKRGHQSLRQTPPSTKSFDFKPFSYTFAKSFKKILLHQLFISAWESTWVLSRSLNPNQCIEARRGNAKSEKPFPLIAYLRLPADRIFHPDSETSKHPFPVFESEHCPYNFTSFKASSCFLAICRKYRKRISRPPNQPTEAAIQIPR